MSILQVSRRLEQQVKARESARKVRRAAVAEAYWYRQAAQTLEAFAEKLAASLATETQALAEERELLERKEARLQGRKWIVEQSQEEATQKRQAGKKAWHRAKIAKLKHDAAARGCVVKTKYDRG